MNQNNLGRFGLSRRLIQNDPDKAVRLFAALRFVPVRAEIVDFGGQVDYVGMSDRFREISDNEVAPYYTIQFAVSEEGVEFIKVEEARGPAGDLSQKYNELIMAVSNKYPDESRHETALRYIQERERIASSSGAKSTEKEREA